MRLKKITPFLLFVVGLALSLYHLQDSPRTWFDEGIYLHIAKVLATHGRFALLMSPGVFHDISLISVGYPLLVPLAIAFKLFGATLLVGRLVMVGYILAFLVAAYFFVREFAGEMYARWSLALLITFNPLFANGKNALGEVPGLFFTVMGLLFLLRAEKKNWALRSLVVSGIFFGLAVATKPSFIPLIPSLFIAYAIHFFSTTKERVPWNRVLAFAAALALPILVWILTQFTATTNIREVLTDYANPYGLANHWTYLSKNLSTLFTVATPLHFMMAFTGLLCVVMLPRREKKMVETTIIFFSLFIFYSYLKTPGWFRYFFLAHALLIMMFPYALSVCMERVRVPHMQKFLTIFLSIMLISQSIRLSQKIDQFYYPPWREVRAHILASPDKKILYYNVAEGAFWAPKENYSQVLTFREGLGFGEENLKNLGAYDEIITRDSNWVEVADFSKDFFKESAHIGNYFIFVRK